MDSIKTDIDLQQALEEQLKKEKQEARDDLEQTAEEVMRLSSPLFALIMKDSSPEVQKITAEIMNSVSDVYSNSYVAIHMFRVIGEQMKDIADLYGFKNELYPGTATTTLKYWENRFQIADSSSDNEFRRERILSKFYEQLRINPAKLEVYVKNLVKYDLLVNVEEIYDEYTFNVYLSAVKPSTNYEKIINEIRRIKPSHLRLGLLHVTTENRGAYFVGTAFKQTRCIKIGL